jgi:phytoene synthase
MLADTSKQYYATYEELQTYMHGSAEVIGLMVCQIADVDQEGWTAAKLLGEAMQYTNFLRDVAEDWYEHQRIYIPQDRLQAYQLTHEDIKHMVDTQKPLPQWESFLQEEIAFTR